MDSTTYIGAAIFALILVVSLVKARVFRGRAKLPQLPPAGPLPLGELSKYYDLNQPPIAWERVRGWSLNEAPPTLSSPAPIDHVILLPTLLEFCSGASGKLELAFNFLVGAIQRVEFDPNALPGTGQGLVSVFTPSGRTLFVATPAFAQTLDRAVRNPAILTTQ